MQEGVVYRDEYGNVIDKELWYEKRIIKNKRSNKGANYKNRLEKDPEFVKYSSGVIQFEEAKKHAERQKSLMDDEVIDGGRYFMSKSYDDELRKKDIWDDPIKLINAQSHATPSSKLKSNYVDLEAKRLKCKFTSPQNRFSIESGYRWDGVVRGNGFEESYLKKKNEINNNMNYID